MTKSFLPLRSLDQILIILKSSVNSFLVWNFQIFRYVSLGASATGGWHLMFTNIQSDLCHGGGWDWAALELHPCWELLVTALPEVLGGKHPRALVWRAQGRWLTFSICMVITFILSTRAKIRPRMFKRNLAFLKRDHGTDCKFQGTQLSLLPLEDTR